MFDYKISSDAALESIDYPSEKLSGIADLDIMNHIWGIQDYIRQQHARDLRENRELQRSNTQGSN